MSHTLKFTTQNAIPDLLNFVTLDMHTFMACMTEFREEIDVFDYLDSQYRSAIERRHTSENGAVPFQLFLLCHFRLLMGFSALLRGHLSDALLSERIALDAAIVAATIIADRSLTSAYLKRQKPFDKLVRKYKNDIRDSKPLPHRHLPDLIMRMDLASKLAAHADIYAFSTRLSAIGSTGKRFQFRYSEMTENKLWHRERILQFIMSFTAVADVFSRFLLEEKLVPPEWAQKIDALGRKLHHHLHPATTGQSSSCTT